MHKTSIYLLTCSLFILGLLFIPSLFSLCSSCLCSLLILSLFIVHPIYVQPVFAQPVFFFILYLFIVHPVLVHCSSYFCSSCLCSSCICSACLYSACLWWVQLTLPFLKNLVVDRSQRPGAKWKKRNCKCYQLNVSIKIWKAQARPKTESDVTWIHGYLWQPGSCRPGATGWGWSHRWTPPLFWTGWSTPHAAHKTPWLMPDTATSPSLHVQCVRTCSLMKDSYMYAHISRVEEVGGYVSFPRSPFFIIHSVPQSYEMCYIYSTCKQHNWLSLTTKSPEDSSDSESVNFYTHNDVCAEL